MQGLDGEKPTKILLFNLLKQLEHVRGGFLPHNLLILIKGVWTRDSLLWESCRKRGSCEHQGPLAAKSIQGVIKELV